MNNAEKRAYLYSIRNCLLSERIPFEYNSLELTIKIKGIDVTDVLLAVHNWSGKFITDLIKENEELKEINKGSCRIRDKLASIGLPTFMSCKETVDKLTDAKEIIKGLYDQVCGRCSDDIELLERTQKFLKECE